MGLIEIVELKLSSITTRNYPAPYAMIDEFRAFANTRSRSWRVIVCANFDANVNAFSTNQLSTYEKRLMLESSWLHFHFLRTFYIEDEVSIWHCFWHVSCSSWNTVVSIIFRLIIVICFRYVNGIWIFEWSTPFL